MASPLFFVYLCQPAAGDLAASTPPGLEMLVFVARRIDRLHFLDADADPSCVIADFQDTGIHFHAFTQHFIGFVEPDIGDLGNMAECVNARGDLHKGTKGEHAHHSAAYDRTHRESALHIVTRIVSRLLVA